MHVDIGSHLPINRRSPGVFMMSFCFVEAWQFAVMRSLRTCSAFSGLVFSAVDVPYIGEAAISRVSSFICAPLT